MTTFDRAIAELNAQSDATAVLLARVEADKRYNALCEYAAMFAPAMPRHGVAGFADIVVTCTSPRYWRTQRAKVLASARRYQVMGKRSFAAPLLRKAAHFRLTEATYRNMEGTDASLANMRAEHDEGRVGDTPVNLLDAVRAAGLRPDVPVTLNTVADLVCAAVCASTSLDAEREDGLRGVHVEAAE